MLFEKVKKNFGFGFMSLLMIEKAVDYEQVNQMVDAFMEAGFNYFDTARVYLDGDSEIAIRECVAKRQFRRVQAVVDAGYHHLPAAGRDRQHCRRHFLCCLLVYRYHRRHHRH